MIVAPLLSSVQSTLAQVLLQALPHGGQRLARRNAWASMTADAATARARREAAAAFEARLAAPRDPALIPVRTAR